MASRTPSARSIRPSVGAAVRRTLIIDWPLNMVVDTNGDLLPFTHTFQTPSLTPATGDFSTISCVTEYSPNDENGILILLDLGPIFSQFPDAADRGLTGHHVQASIMISLIITTAPLALTRTFFDRITPLIFGTSSPAAIEALAVILDQPGGHDAAPASPDQTHLYADRYVLWRASPHFRHLFAVRNRESGIVPPVGVAVGPIEGGKGHPTGEAGELPRARSGSDSPSRSRRMSERDIMTITGSRVLTPMTSVHSDDTKGFMFQRTTSPLMDDNVFVMNINETSLKTFRAF
ncbi:hypothetical protein FRC00_004073 [Tulasnella sp. 408]|nr:hypothetical protein FRC00_004073 [Tulasnella sp. 408]